MKVGDVVRFVGSWAGGDGPKVGIVMETWTNGRTKRLSSVDVFWDNEKLGNVDVKWVELVNELEKIIK